MSATHLEGGFNDPAVDAAHAFRAMMAVTAEPGTIRKVEGAQPPTPMSIAAGVVLLSLCDADTPVHLAGAHDNEAIRSWIAFHTSAPLAGADQCRFAFGTWEDLSPISRFAIGTSEYPDRSATLIVEMTDITTDGAKLRGPGIKTSAALSLPETAAFEQNRALFPLGVDFFFTAADKIAALPRSTEVF